VTGHIAPTRSSTSRCTAAALTQGPATACVMVEVTSAALLSGPILVRAAFASTGANDLTALRRRALPDVAAPPASVTPADCRRLAELAFTAEYQPMGTCRGARAASRAARARALIPPLRGGQASHEYVEGFTDVVACGDTPEL
jgi:phosphotransferase system enzyme I (PtsI)